MENEKKNAGNLKNLINNPIIGEGSPDGCGSSFQPSSSIERTAPVRVEDGSIHCMSAE